jgi:hypothetical protein
MLIYTHCWKLMNSMGSHCCSSLPLLMKVMVCHFVSDSHEVMTVLIVMEISLQLHRSLFSSSLGFLHISSHSVMIRLVRVYGLLLNTHNNVML